MKGKKYMEDSIVFSDFLLKNFNEYGSKTALIYGDCSLTYADLIGEISVLMSKIKELRLSSIAICMENKMHLITLTIACMSSGIPFIVIDKSNPMSFLQDILDEAQISTVIKDNEIYIENRTMIDYGSLKKQES